MAITILCPRLRCRAVLRVPDDVRGKRVRCAQCGLAFFVPKAGEAKGKSTKPPAGEAAPQSRP